VKVLYRAKAGFYMFYDKPPLKKGDVVEIDMDVTDISWINYWTGVGYLSKARNHSGKN
jgi:hypothetical protein